jgi:hypothetical protein
MFSYKTPNMKLRKQKYDINGLRYYNSKNSVSQQASILPTAMYSNESRRCHIFGIQKIKNGEYTLHIHCSADSELILHEFKKLNYIA